MCGTSHSGINLRFFNISVNILMRILNGNGNSYKLAIWNCRKGLICSNKYPTSKVIEIKKLLYELNIHIMCLIEVDIHGAVSIQQTLSDKN